MSNEVKSADYAPTSRLPGKSEAAAQKASAKSAGLPSHLIDANDEHRHEQGLLGDLPHDEHDLLHTHGARAPPPVRLISKRAILAITGLTFPTIWKMMRAGTFPRSRIVGGKSMWLSNEIDAWLANLPVRALKGDDANVEEVA
jgi:predicted DNA-binding transcriptional regulator AlpA